MIKATISWNAHNVGHAGYEHDLLVTRNGDEVLNLTSCNVERDSVDSYILHVMTDGIIFGDIYAEDIDDQREMEEE